LKRLLSFILAVCLVATCAFSMTACAHQHTFSSEWSSDQTNHWKSATCEHTGEKISFGSHVYDDGNDNICNTCAYDRSIVSAENKQLSETYKNIAVALWKSIGVEDPTANELQSASAFDKKKFPEIKGETNDKTKINNIETNANTTAGIFYMLSLLYKNFEFAFVDGVAYFDASCSITIGGSTITNDYTFKIKPELDVENNLVKLELTSTVMGTTQYSYMEMNFDFATNTLKAYDFYSMVVELNAIVGMSLTEDGKYLFTEPSSGTDQFAEDVKKCKKDFDEKTKNHKKIKGNFDKEMQSYFDVLSSVLSELEEIL